MSRSSKLPARPMCSAVVPAAGSGVRMGGPNKLLLTLRGIPVLGYALLSLEQCGDIDEIIIAARPADIVPYGDIVRDFGIRKAVKIIRGGETRLHSVYNAVRECSDRAALIAVHDGARPFATPELISRVISAAARHGAAVPCLQLTDTIKTFENGAITGTANRDALRAVQTPQVFDAKLLHGALYRALTECPGVTDDCAAVEALGIRVAAVPGEVCNIKLTGPGDLALAGAILGGATVGR